jgi:hypothetical protein
LPCQAFDVDPGERSGGDDAADLPVAGAQHLNTVDDTASRWRSTDDQVQNVASLGTEAGHNSRSAHDADAFGESSESGRC